ncbi:hypothetical protein XNC3_2450028 [Xenorhabdus nematophila F1]|nr:hypothetical protein XNC3_2450028 [Xenorhabdus nematophila F1]
MRGLSSAEDRDRAITLREGAGEIATPLAPEDRRLTSFYIAAKFKPFFGVPQLHYFTGEITWQDDHQPRHIFVWSGVTHQSARLTLMNRCRKKGCLMSPNILGKWAGTGTNGSPENWIKSVY